MLLKCAILFLGLDEIQEFTKQSLKTKPFLWAIGKEWEENPRKTDLRKIHTDLSWTRKHRKAHRFITENIHSITDVRSEDDLREGGPVRILMQGKDTHACDLKPVADPGFPRGIIFAKNCTKIKKMDSEDDSWDTCIHE